MLSLSKTILEGYALKGGEECLSCWLLLPEGISGKEFEQMAGEKGVSVYANDRFAVGYDDGSLHWKCRSDPVKNIEV